MKRATFAHMLDAACFAYFAIVTRGGTVARFFRAGGTWFVYFTDKEQRA